MKIRNLGFIYIILAISILGYTIFSVFNQFNNTRKLTDSLQRHQKALVQVNEFHVLVNNQVLYGVDLVRTGNISGERIISYRMTETMFSRSVEELKDLYTLGEEYTPLTDDLINKGTAFSELCSKELLQPLYNNQSVDQEIIEVLIYTELNEITRSVNALRNHLSEDIERDITINSRQFSRFMKINLPVLAIILLLVIVLSSTIMFKILSSIKHTGIRLKELSEGNSNLDVRLPARGNNEISILCRAFNDFISNLETTNKALFNISDNHVSSGDKLNQITLEHRKHLSRLYKSIESVSLENSDLGERTKDSAEELKKIEQSVRELDVMIQQQEALIIDMTNHGKEIESSLVSQTEAIEEQVSFSTLIKNESDENRKGLLMISKQIEEILSDSRRINNLMSKVYDLSEQTNILAVNASIRAAHAGDFGKKFMVVTKEMHNLAEKTKIISGEVNSLLSGLTSKLDLMALEEKQNRNSLEKLSSQNIQSERAIAVLKESIHKISSRLAGFSSMIDQVKEGSELVRDQSRSVTDSSNRITGKLETLNTIQNQINLELSQMNNSIGDIQYKTDSLDQLSKSNYQSAIEMKVQIKRLSGEKNEAEKKKNAV